MKTACLPGSVTFFGTPSVNSSAFSRFDPLRVGFRFPAREEKPDHDHTAGHHNLQRVAPRHIAACLFAIRCHSGFSLNESVCHNTIDYNHSGGFCQIMRTEFDSRRAINAARPRASIGSRAEWADQTGEERRYIVNVHSPGRMGYTLRTQRNFRRAAAAGGNE